MKKTENSVMPCLMQAWDQNENQLLAWLQNQTHDEHLAQDLLHEVFIRALCQRQAFCEITNTKAWLFKVAGNLIIDQARKPIPLPMFDDVEQEEPESLAVDSLAHCLPRVLHELAPQDSELLKACDIQGMTQQQYATLHGLTLSALKSRLLRARAKLKHQLSVSCQVKFDENQHVCCFTPQKEK